MDEPRRGNEVDERVQADDRHEVAPAPVCQHTCPTIRGCSILTLSSNLNRDERHIIVGQAVAGVTAQRLENRLLQSRR